MNAGLEARAVETVRAGRTLLAGVSLHVAPGRVTALLGSNGAGKSTLLRTLAGELTPDRGGVTWNGESIRAWSPQRLAQLRAVVSQDIEFRGEFSVAEVVRLGFVARRPGLSPTEEQSIAAEALDWVGLEAFGQRSMGTLSGGEQQRVHLSRALVQLGCLETERQLGRVLLLDEPTSSLDPRHQHAVLGRVRTLARERGLAVLVILHDWNLALRYADDAAVLTSGRLLASGCTRDVLVPSVVQEALGLEAVLFTSGRDACPMLGLRPVLEPAVQGAEHES